MPSAIAIAAGPARWVASRVLLPRLVDLAALLVAALAVGELLARRAAAPGWRYLTGASIAVRRATGAFLLVAAANLLCLSAVLTGRLAGGRAQLLFGATMVLALWRLRRLLGVRRQEAAAMLEESGEG